MANKRVKRANPYDLYRTCKQAGTCPPDVIPKVEGSTVADKILQYGSMGVFLGGLGIGTGQGKPVSGGYVPLRTFGSTSSLASTASRGATVSKPFAGGIPLETLETIGAFRPSAVEESSLGTGVGLSNEAPAILIPDSAPSGDTLGGLDVSTDSSADTLITLLEPEGPDDIAVLEVRPTEHSRAHLSFSSTHPNPLYHYVEPAAIGETSTFENVLVGGSGIGDNYSESIELNLFSEPKTSTPEPAFKRPRLRGIFNYFSRRYYTQLPTSDPDPGAAAGSYVFENPVFDSKAFEPELPTDNAPAAAPNEEAPHVSAAKLLQGPSGRVGISRIVRPTSMGTRSGVRVGPLYHLRHSFSTIAPSAESVELVPTVLEEGEVITTVAESHLGDNAFEEVDLDSVTSDTPLLDTEHLSHSGKKSNLPAASGTSRPLIAVEVDSGQSEGLHPARVRDISTNHTHYDPDTTSTVVIDGNIVIYSTYLKHYYLHPSLYRRRRKRLLD